MTLKQGIKRMEKLGYHYYEEISCRGYYAFTYEWYVVPTYFETVKELEHFIKWMEKDN